MKNPTMFLVDGKYNPKTDNPIYWFLNTKTQNLEPLIIPESDSDSCFKQIGMTEQQIIEAVESQKGAKGSIKGIDWITQYDLLNKIEIKVARVRMHSARQVGNFATKTSNESHIKRIYRHAFDKQWYFGMPYDRQFHAIESEIDPSHQKMLEHHNPALRDRILQWCLAEIPQMNCKALDIEVYTHGQVIPTELEALNPVIAVAVDYNTDRIPNVYALSPKARGMINHNARNNPALTEMIRQGTINIHILDNETELLEHVFQEIREKGYPLITTFYGSQFDLPYLFTRAKLLGFSKDSIPIECRRRGWPTKSGQWVSEWGTVIPGKLHLDQNKFFDLPIIKNYVFKNKYLESSLESISQELLGIGKVKHPGERISEMPLADLIYYNYYDSHLTIKLLQHDDSIIMKIIFLFMRLGRQPFGDGAHRAISSKIINLLFGHMIERNILIPNVEQLKKIGLIESKGKGETKFEGARILIPKKDIHFRTKTMDFASLYPSRMHTHNVSFETMNCGHEECMNDPACQVPGLSHYTCSKYLGIYSQLIGLVKDIRIKIFKPQAKTNPTASGIEQALKTFINASFGVTGDYRFGLYCPPCAESTTALGRDALDRLKVKAESYPGVELIFGDTDSIGLTGPGLNDQVVKELQEWSDTELGIELAHEYSTIIFVVGEKKGGDPAKKTYFYIEEKTYKVVVKGMTGKKRDKPQLIMNCFKETLDKIAELCKTSPIFQQEVIDKEKATEKVREIIIETTRKYFTKIWYKEGSIEDYAVTTHMTKAISEYRKTEPRHVKAAKKLAKHLKDTSGKAYRHASLDSLVPAGTYIQYVCKAKSGLQKKGNYDPAKPNIKIEPIPLMIAKQSDICSEKYHEILISTMRQIMGPLEIPVEDIVTTNPEIGSLEAFF